MPILKKVLAGAVAPGALVLWSVSMVLVNPAPAHAEKTAEQIKCEEDGGSWVDKGEGNTFCFKKLPPMSKADGRRRQRVVRRWQTYVRPARRYSATT